MTDLNPKATLRAQALARRGLVTAAETKAFARRLAEIGSGLAAEHHATAASGFWPIKNEPSTLPLLDTLAGRGIVTALPVMTGRDQPLTFRAWKQGEPLVEVQMKIKEPPPEAREVLPDLLFVPLAAFDRKGGRLGYGAGYYDRTLAKLRTLKKITAVGIAFGVQELLEIPQESHDEPLDYVLTERDLIFCRP
jgi:5-formyltetrahydrofolate cyclo-ligase